MSVQAVRQALEAAGFSGTIRELEESSATVELAAAALGCQGARIAKTLSFLTAGGPVLIGWKPWWATPPAAYAPSPFCRACAPIWMNPCAVLRRSFRRPAPPTARWR